MPRLFVILTLALAVCYISISRVQPSNPSPDAANDAPAMADEVLVRLSEAWFGLSNAQLAQRLHASVIARLPDLSSLRLRLRAGETPDDAIDRIGALPGVEMVERNLIVRSTMSPNDPFFSTAQPYLSLIEAPDAWDVELGSPNVIVAVLDTGIDLDHPDLQGRVWNNPNEIENNNKDDDNNGCIDDRHGCNFITREVADEHCTAPGPGDVHDDNGHGTFISGIIAANGNNGIGMSGLAPGVTILPVKILDCYGGGTAVEAAQAVLYAAKQGARVANISFGADGESSTLTSAIKEAYDKYGMVLVAASGNDGERGVTYPARLPQTLAVGSSGIPTDPNARSPFSNWGPEVQVVAPGLNIVSTVARDRCSTWVCQQDQPYAVASGTSFAAPMVSALAALILSHQPYLTPEAVRRIIVGSAAPLPDGDSPGWAGAGRIRMRQALTTSKRFYILSAPGVARP